MATQWARRLGRVLAAGGLLLAFGCGQKSVTVEGTVTLDGSPVEIGTISFVPADGKGPSMGGEVKGGKYRVTGSVRGKKTVSVTAVRKTGKSIEAGPPAPPGTMVDELRTISSTESCELVDGQNSHKFELKSPAP
jgi:hypothetical protein